MRKVYLIIIVMLFSLLVFAVTAITQQDYDNMTPDQKADYLISADQAGTQKAKTLLVEDEITSKATKIKLGEEFFKQTLEVSVFKISDAIKFRIAEQTAKNENTGETFTYDHLIIESAEGILLTDIRLDQLAHATEINSIKMKGFEITDTGKINVLSDSGVFMDMSNNIESFTSYTNGFEAAAPDKHYIEYYKAGNIIKAQKIKVLNEEIVIENPYSDSVSQISTPNGILKLSVDGDQKNSKIVIQRDSSERITGIQVRDALTYTADKSYTTELGSLTANIKSKLFKVEYDAANNPTYTIVGEGSVDYRGSLKTKLNDETSKVTFSPRPTGPVDFTLKGNAEASYDYLSKYTYTGKGDAVDISGTFDLEILEVNTEMAKNDFAFKKDGKDYNYDIVDTESKQFYSVSSLDLGQKRDINSQVEGCLIFDIDTPEKVSRFGRIRYKRNGLERSVDDVNFDIDDGTIVMPSRGYSVWQDPAGFYLQLNERGEVYMTTNVLREIISEEAVGKEFHLAGEGGSPFFMRRTAKGFEIYDYSEPSHRVILHTENIDFNDVDQYRAFTERLTRVWQK